MSIEEKIQELIETINQLIRSLSSLTQAVEYQQGIEAGELEMYGPEERTISAGEGEPPTISPGLLQEFPEGRGETPAGETPPEPEPAEPEPEGANEKTLELIALAKELGYEYLYHEGKLAVDNRVLDEFNRRHLENNLEP